ncbi:MAG TPA: sensor domain-containing diguanylate cyclase [Gaiellales bacterium]|jgi:diguanylate cyclase (GGDEF)-like protein|nr:sensor domain-containing diguanylate cyclase [Gaiellales bacterium]
MSWGDRDRRELEVLHRVAIALSHSLALSEVMDTLAHELTLALERADEATISVWLEDEDALEAAAVCYRDTGVDPSERGKVYRLSDFPWLRVLLRAGAGHIQQRLTAPELDPSVVDVLTEWNWRSWVALPLSIDDKAVGVIELADYRSARRWSRRDIEFCETIAGQAALALRNAQMYENLRSRAARDPLTGLLNHRAFYERLTGELERLGDGDRTLTVVVIDLDNFKLVNDSLGHTEGDRTLRAAADALRSVCRREDAAGRLGGDEFALLLPDLPDPTALAARVLDGVRRQARVDASVGITICRPGEDTPASAVDRADRSLRAAKVAGKSTFRFDA